MRTLFVMALALVAFCSNADARGYNITHHRLVTSQHHRLVMGQHIGYASYYGSGYKTASGERFSPKGYTAAHRTLPFGTKVRVTNLRTGRTVIVRINDRGPFIRGRIIDLSLGAAQRIGMIAAGVARVRITIL